MVRSDRDVSAITTNVLGNDGQINSTLNQPITNRVESDRRVPDELDSRCGSNGAAEGNRRFAFIPVSDFERLSSPRTRELGREPCDTRINVRPDIRLLFIRSQGVITRAERMRTMLAWFHDPQYGR